MARDAPVGVLDWGIGGLGFCRAFKERFPSVPLLYFSDSGVLPYGRLRRADLRQRLSLVFDYFAAQGVRRLVIACNAASAALIGTDEVVRAGGETMAIAGMIEPAVRSVLASGGRRVGVIGGRGTIRSGIYRRLLAPSVESVSQRIAQPLSALIEQGDRESPFLVDTVARILAPLSTVDALLLACTHYAAIQPIIQSTLPSAMLIDPVPELLSQTARQWELDMPQWEVARDRFVTTGDPAQMSEAARIAFSISITSITRVALR